MKDIHRAGRPARPMALDDAKRLLREYETNSTRKLAQMYGVSQTAICQRLKKARMRLGVTTDETTKSKSIQ